MTLDSLFNDAVHCCLLQHLRVLRVLVLVTSASDRPTASAARRAPVTHTRTVVSTLMTVQVATVVHGQTVNSSWST